MKRLIISNLNIVENIIEIDDDNLVSYTKTLPEGYKTLAIPKNKKPHIGGVYKNGKFNLPLVLEEKVAKKNLKLSEGKVADILEELISLTDVTSPTLKTWITERTENKEKLK
tara:strand:- start:105 stop:440 length:336 start_codon:yes stop_codon:yes gene_type:complete